MMEMKTRSEVAFLRGYYRMLSVSAGTSASVFQHRYSRCHEVFDDFRYRRDVKVGSFPDLSADYRRRLMKRPPVPPVHHFRNTRLATCHFGATDISAPLGSGINMSRAESCCTRLLLEFRSRKRFANYVLFGQVRRETWAGVFQKTALFSAGAANFKSLASTISATSSL
jgi:hypothetical protein